MRSGDEAARMPLFSSGAKSLGQKVFAIVLPLFFRKQPDGCGCGIVCKHRIRVSIDQESSPFR